MSNNFVFRKTLHEIVTCKIEPFIEKIFAQCNFESVQTSLLIEELVDSFSDQENYSTFRLILQRLFKPHVALTFDQFKKEHLSKKLINLLYQYKFTPTFCIVDEDIDESKINKDDVVIEETHVNKALNGLFKENSSCNNDSQPSGKVDVINDIVNTRISYKNELVNVIEELKCENQYLKLQNDTLITGNPHAQCEIMNQQLIEELKKLETELKTKKKEQEETLQKQLLNMYTKESSQVTKTDQFSSQELEANEDEEKFITANLEEMNEYLNVSKEIKKSNLLEMEEYNNEPSLECKIQQIKDEKNKLLEENERLKKEIEIRQKLRDTEVLDITTAKCDHTDHNSTGTFEDLEELIGSIQNLEEENQAKDSLIEDYKSQLYELQCYLKLTRQSTSPLKSKVSLTVRDCRASKSFQEELIELEHHKSTTQDKNKSDSELLKIDTELLKQNYKFITSTSQDTPGNSRLNIFDYEHSTTSEEDCDISRISHWDCSQLNRNSFNVSNKETAKDSEDKPFIDDLLMCDSGLNHTEQNIYPSDLFDTTDPNIDFLPSPIRPVRNNTEELISDFVVEANCNSAFLKNKRELIPRQLICQVLSNSIPEETSNEKDVESTGENTQKNISDRNDILNQPQEIANTFSESTVLIQNNMGSSNLNEKMIDGINKSKEEEVVSEIENVNRSEGSSHSNNTVEIGELIEHKKYFVKSEILTVESNEHKKHFLKSELLMQDFFSEIDDLKRPEEIFNKEISSKIEMSSDKIENYCLNEETPYQIENFIEGSKILHETDKREKQNHISVKGDEIDVKDESYKTHNLNENKAISDKLDHFCLDEETEELKEEEIGDKRNKVDVKEAIKIVAANINEQEESSEKGNNIHLKHENTNIINDEEESSDKGHYIDFKHENTNIISDINDQEESSEIRNNIDLKYKITSITNDINDQEENSVEENNIDLKYKITNTTNDINDQEESSDTGNTIGIKCEVTNITNDVHNQEEISDKGNNIDLKCKITNSTEKLIEKDSILDKLNEKEKRNKMDENEISIETVDIKQKIILHRANIITKQKEIPNKTIYLVEKNVISDKTENSVQQKETLSNENFKSCLLNEREILVGDQWTEEILSKKDKQDETNETNLKSSFGTTEENTLVKSDENPTAGIRTVLCEPCEHISSNLIKDTDSSHSINCNQCVNVKEVIDLFESLYRKNLTNGDCSGHITCNRERKSDDDACKKHTYRNIFNQMNDKLKEFKMQGFDHNAFQQYREPNNDILFEPHSIILTETIQKCLHGMNESFSQEFDSCENSRDEVEKKESFNVLDLNDLIKDFNCLQLRGEPSTISNEVDNNDLKNTKHLGNNSAKNNETEEDRIVQDTQVVQYKSKNLTNTHKRSKNQNHAINNISQIKSNLHSVTINGEIPRVSNNISQTVSKNTSLANHTNNFNNSLQENALVTSSKDIAKMTKSFENKRAAVVSVYGNKRNNIESSHFRKGNKNIEDKGQKVNVRSVRLYERVEENLRGHSESSRSRTRSLNPMFELSSDVSCMKKTTTQNHDTIETFTISGSTICRFSLHLFRLLISLVVLFTLLLLALIWYQETGRRQCPTCSQLLTFLGDLLAAKLQHLDGPPPI